MSSSEPPAIKHCEESDYIDDGKNLLHFGLNFFPKRAMIYFISFRKGPANPLNSRYLSIYVGKINKSAVWMHLIVIVLLLYVEIFLANKFNSRSLYIEL
jgi:hypothetical protein